jgi:hypothetical protein
LHFFSAVIFGVKNKIFLGYKIKILGLKKIILGWFFIWGKRINFGVKKINFGVALNLFSFFNRNFIAFKPGS